jgi:hypothetical protein
METDYRTFGPSRIPCRHLRLRIHPRSPKFGESIPRFREAIHQTNPTESQRLRQTLADEPVEEFLIPSREQMMAGPNSHINIKNIVIILILIYG